MSETTTAVQETHFAGIIIFRQGQEGEVEFFVLDSDHRGVITTKFPGGMNEPGEPPEETVRREAREEGGYKDVAFWGPVYNLEIVGTHHQKIFFAAHGISNNLRGQPRQEKILDGEDTLYPPRWIGSGEALAVLAYYHRKALLEAIAPMARFDPKGFGVMALADPVLARFVRQ